MAKKKGTRVGRQSGARRRRRSIRVYEDVSFLFLSSRDTEKRPSRRRPLSRFAVSFAARKGQGTNRAESRLEIFRGNRSRPRRARRGVRARPSVAGRRRVTARRARRLVSVCQASAVETRAEREAGCGDARGGHRASSGGPVRSPGPTRWEARDARVGFRAGGASRNTRTELGTSPLAAAARLKHSPMTPRASRVTYRPREVVK